MALNRCFMLSSCSFIRSIIMLPKDYFALCIVIFSYIKTLNCLVIIMNVNGCFSQLLIMRTDQVFHNNMIRSVGQQWLTFCQIIVWIPHIFLLSLTNNWHNNLVTWLRLCTSSAFFGQPWTFLSMDARICVRYFKNFI